MPKSLALPGRPVKWNLPIDIQALVWKTDVPSLSLPMLLKIKAFAGGYVQIANTKRENGRRLTISIVAFSTAEDTLFAWQGKVGYLSSKASY